MAISTHMSGLSLLCLVLMLLPIPGSGAQELQVLQPQRAVSVPAGETLTLPCSVTGVGPAGAVRWLKGSGSDRQLVYEQTGSFPRVTRAEIGSNTDYTIRISDTRPADAGVYRCVKFQRMLVGEHQEYKSGNGTAVSVSARPSAPSVSGPPSRAEPGHTVNFTCTSGGFSPRDITVTWLKNGARLPEFQTRVSPEQESVSYSVSSTVGVSLAAGDAPSQLTCRIQHSTLSAPLQGTYNLSDVLRVPPRLQVATDPPLPVTVNKSVTFTCSVQQFYPQNVRLIWLENGNELDRGKSSPLAENPDGTYTVQSYLEVNAAEQRNQSVFTCQVVHDSQPPVSASETLKISQLPAEPAQSVFSSPAIWIGIFLEKMLVAAFLLFLFWRSKGPTATSWVPRAVTACQLLSAASVLLLQGTSP